MRRSSFCPGRGGNDDDDGDDDDSDSDDNDDKSVATAVFHQSRVSSGGNGPFQLLLLQLIGHELGSSGVASVWTEPLYHLLGVQLHITKP